MGEEQQCQKKNKKSKKITPKNHPNSQNIGRVPMYGIVRSIVFFYPFLSLSHLSLPKDREGKELSGERKNRDKKIIENNTKRQLNIGIII